MLFGGIQKNSLIDYPGMVCCVLFTRGCNFHCPYCHNPQLLNPRHPESVSIDEEVILDFLRGRKGLLDGVVISGGEPTIQGDLVSFSGRIKSMGYSLKLDTNGGRPDVLEELIRSGYVDYVAMDIKADPRHYPPVISGDADPDLITESIRIIMSSDLPYEFRTTCVRPFVDGPIMEEIGRIVRGARLYALQSFRPSGGILQPEFFQGEEAGGYDPEGMMVLKSAIEPWVNACVLR